MTRYNPCIQQTFGTLLMAGLLATSYGNLALSNSPESIAYPQAEPGQSRRIVISGTSATLETFSNMHALEYTHHDEYFETEVTAFFQQLSSSQVKLGDTFEKILFDNIWDLYQN